MAHPYRSYPDRQFWEKAVHNAFHPADVANFDAPLINPSDKVVTAGSCFAANLVPFLEQAGFNYLRTEYTHPLFQQIPLENLSYAKFSAGYGNIYTATQLHQLLLRALGEFAPQERFWRLSDTYVDPFRPGLKYAAHSQREFEALAAAHLKSVKRAFTECDVFIFTLGLTEAWVSKIDGAVFPACPGTVTGDFDANAHVFHNFSVTEVSRSLDAFIVRLREINPAVRILLTVSPVPLVATAEPSHVLAATVYSKSVLRVAAEMATQSHKSVHYFPAYELVTGPQAPKEFYEPDRRNVSALAVETVMAAFLAACGQSKSSRPDPAAATPPPPVKPTAALLSIAVADMECEEAAQAR